MMLEKNIITPTAKIELTPYQKIFYYEWLQDPQRSDYNIVMDSTVNGHIDTDRFQKSLSKLIDQHLIFSHNVENTDGELYWKHRTTPARGAIYHSQALTDDELYDIISKPFDLEKDQLIDIRLIRLEANKYRILFIFPHISIDGLSTDEMYKEWANFYNNSDYNKDLNIKDQIEFNNNLASNFNKILSDNKQKIHDFWDKRLKKLEGIDLSFLKVSSVPEYRKYRFVSEYIFSINNETFLKTKSLKIYKLTPYIFGQMILGILLHKITGQTDIGITYPIAITEGKELACGAHVNTLIIDYHIDSDTTLNTLIERTVSFFKELKIAKARYLPINEIAKYINNTSILDIGFAQTFLRDHSIDLNGITLDHVNHKFHIDLVNKILFEQEQHENQLNYRIRYDDHVLDKDLVLNFIKMYENLFYTVLDDLLAENHDKKVTSYEIINSTQISQLSEWNSTDIEIPQEKLIHQLFEEQADRNPDQIAIVCKGEKLTYKQVDTIANKVANYLINNCDIQPDDIVPLYLERNIFTLTALLGVLKAGAAYVPLDTKAPTDRISYILEDVKAKVIITDKAHSDISDISNLPLVIMDDTKAGWTSSSNTPTKTSATSTSLAYVIYTSGTTGKPKGVMIEHHNVLNLALMQGESFGLNSDDNKNCLWYANYVFDAHVSEVFTALCYGHTLHMVDDVYRTDIYRLEEYIRVNQIWIATIPPVLLDTECLLPLHTLVVAGDVTPLKVMEAYRTKGTVVLNAYGPTEATVCATIKEYAKGALASNIGKPIANVRVYVLDANLQRVPIGAVGELYIGGAGVARGYLNNHVLTDERFIENPFVTTEEMAKNRNLILYRSGDMVRCLPNGDVEFLGRNDFQVKIRGYRIELSEIENCLMGMTGIDQVACVVRQNAVGAKFIVAYFVGDRSLADSELSRFLSERLPDYMVPSVFMGLEVLPMTVNGKLDRGALPDPMIEDETEIIAPTNETEKTLCEIFAEVLGLEVSKVGIDCDFFRLGGDSISSIQLSNRIRKYLNIKISIKEIFQYKTVKSLSKYIQSLSQDTLSSIKSEQGILEGSSKLLPIQEWFFDNMNKGLYPSFNHWNQTFMLKVPLLNKEILAKSFEKLREQHDALNFIYSRTNNPHDYLQFYKNAPNSITLNHININSLSSEHELNQILDNSQKSLDIFNNQLICVNYIEGYSDSSARIHFAIHHLIIDAVSWRIIKNDLNTIYNYLLTHKDSDITKINISSILDEKGTSYRQWVEAVSDYKNEHQQEYDYWKILTRNIPNRNKKLAEKVTNSWNKIEYVLNETKTTSLIRQIHQVYNTQPNDILLSALSLALEKLTGEKENYITLEGHGRESIFHDIDLTNTVGWFTTLYPVKLISETDYLQTVAETKDILKRIPNNGLGYGSLIGYTTGELPRIGFNYLGQFDETEQANSDLWSFSKDYCGLAIASENKDSNILSINCGVIDNKLNFLFASSIPENLLSEFVESYVKCLEQIIDLLVNEKRKYLTLGDIDFIISQSYLNSIQAEKEVDNIYLANSLQQGFIYHSLSQGSFDEAYRSQLRWDYHSDINIDKLQDAWKMAQDKYPSLRLRFAWDEEIVQIIDKEGTIDWRYFDISELSEKEQDEYINSLVEKDKTEIYDLSKGSLFRLYIIKQKNNFYSCIFNNHHSILDGWSNSTLLMYVHNTYLNLLKELPVDNDIDTSYPNAQRYLQSDNSRHNEFWNNYLKIIESNEDLSSLLKPQNRNIQLSEYKYIQEPKVQSTEIVGEQQKQIKDLCQSQGITLNAFLQYCWHKLLNVYGNSDVTVTGMTVSGRNIPIEGIEESVGLYINTLPIILQHFNKKAIDAIKELQQYINEVNSSGEVNLAKLQKGGNRLFNTLFVFENYPIPEDLHSGNELSIKYKGISEKQDYPLVLTVYEQGDTIEIKLQYAGEIFDPLTIQKLLEGFSTITKQLTNNPSVLTSELQLLNNADFKEIVYTSNNTTKEFIHTETIQSLVEEQAAINPNRIAITYQDTHLTYHELNRQANILGNYLKINYNLLPDDLVGLIVNRSEKMLICILATLKAGAAYVPMDPKAPNDRLIYMTENTKVKVILTNTEYQERLEELLPQTSIISIDNTKIEKEYNSHSEQNPKTDVRSNNLAYVIFTSGTTGQPKGVMIEHKNVINLFKSTEDYFGFTNKDVWTLYHSYTFDFSVWEIWGALFYGGKLVIPTYEQTRDIDAFYDLCLKEKVTVLNQTPNAFYQFIDTTINKSQPLKTLRYIIFGGEILNLEQLRPWYDIYKDNSPTLVNMYGITETTVHVTYQKINKNLLNNISFIGTPLPNYTGYVLDRNKQPVPPNVIGELYVGGAGVARGYLNNEELTNERFISNPFQSEGQKLKGFNNILYKSGDLVRLLPEGGFEYIGRNDHQVKIRGFRIELGEIESCLSSHSAIRQSVVLVKENANKSKFLCGYYIANKEIDRNELHEYMSSRLPDYMVPAIFVFLTQLPLTVNGKLNRQALPDPQFTDTSSYVAPRNKMEEQLCQIYSEVLSISALGIEDDFFKLGGDSISSIQLISRIRQRMGIQLNVRDIFTHRTIRTLYNHVISIIDNTPIQIKSEQSRLTGNVGLLPIQKWFLHNAEKGIYPAYNHWNQTFLVKVPTLNVEVLVKSINLLLKHHDAFSLKYKRDSENAYLQSYQPLNKSYELDTLDISNYSDNELETILTNWQNHFDIYNGILFHIGYLYGYPDGTSRIHFALHHLITDAVSWRILKSDLQTIYEALINKTNQEIEVTEVLGKKGTSYRQWVDAVNAYKRDDNEALLEEKKYWQNCLANISQSEQALIAKNRGVKSETEILLNSENTSKLLKDIHPVYGTQINDILLAALSISLKELTGLDENHISLEGHGREYISPELDINNTMGWFTSMYPVSLSANDSEFGKIITQTKEMLKQVPNGGIGYGSIFGYTDGRLPKISFNYLGQFKGDGNKNEWSFVNENTGLAVSANNKDNNILNINGIVIDDKLQFSIVGTISDYDLQVFANQYKETLESIIEYLSAQKRSYLTLSDIDSIINQDLLNRIQAEKEVEAIFKANSLQQGFIYHVLNQGDIDEAYRTQLIWDYDGILDENMLKQAWVYTQKKYAALRLRFSWEDELLQIIDKEGTLSWTSLDISPLKPEEQENHIQNLLAKDRATGYNLASGSLFRIYILKLSEKKYTCVLNNHHAILDGWSNPLVLKYVHTAYKELTEGKEIDARPEKDYLLAQKYLQSKQDNQQQFWKNYMTSTDHSADLSTLLKVDKKQIILSEYKYIQETKDQKLILKDSQYKTLKNICSTYGITLNAMLQYCWHSIISMYSSSETSVVGMTVAGRNIPIEGVEQSVGLFINTLPVIVNHKDEKVIEAIQELQRNINDINSNSNVDLAKLQKGGNRLFNTLFIYENYPAPENTEITDQISFTFKSVNEKQDYPLVVTAYEQKQEAIFTLQYAGELFEDETIGTLLNRISLLLDQLIHNESLKVSQIQYLTSNEYQNIIERWNDTRKSYTIDKSFSKAFEEQATRHPNNIAVKYKDYSLTYHELNRRSNIWAAYLAEKFDIQKGQFVSMYFDRSEDMLVALLAILKTGAAYVPMDTHAPDDRLKYILKETHSNVVLTHKIHVDRLSNLEVNQLSILPLNDTALESEIESKYSAQNLSIDISPNDLMYVLFTSGTTGRPKGVMIEHHSYMNLIYHYKENNFKENKHINTFSVTNYVFDIWGLEYGLTLMSGGMIELGDSNFEALDTSQYTFLQMTPGLLTVKLDNIIFNNKQLKILVGGEAVSEELLKNLFTNHQFDYLLNVYGPTETTIWSTNRKNVKDNFNNSIGCPISNTSIYILDKYLRAVPIGVVGEIHIGGDGVGRGYLNNEEQTHERFINNIYQSPEEKISNYNNVIYKTGDLARYLPDGNIEFVGRNDFQIKIRGLRIELGEIETHLQSHPEIKQAVVVAKEHPNNSDLKFLIAYYTSERELEKEDIQNYLSQYMPEYMLPTSYIHLNIFPLNVNGKVDKKKLPEVELINKQSYVAPTNALEKRICEIYKQILGLESDKISIEEDFFSLGGDSILAIKLINNINKELGKNIHISTVFSHRTIKDLSDYLSTKDVDIQRIRPVNIDNIEDQVLSFAQERMWFIDLYEKGSYAYNIPMVFKLKPEIDIDCLEMALQKTAERHEILRTLIRENKNGEGYQFVLDKPLQFKKQKVASILELNRELKKAIGYIFKLDAEHPIQIKQYVLEDGTTYMSIVLHHIAFDGWSIDLFKQEVVHHYHHNLLKKQNQSTEDSPYPSLPDLTVQYKDFALWQRQYLSNDVLKKHLDYWKNQLTEYEILNFPIDKPRPPFFDYSGADIDFNIGEELSLKLRDTAKKLGVSLYSLLLSGYYLFLRTYSQQNDIIVGTPTANRNYSEISGLIGFFVNNLVLRQRIDQQQSLAEFIKQVGETINQAQAHQDLPFEKLINELDIVKDTSKHPLFQVLFSLQKFGSDSATIVDDLLSPYDYKNIVPQTAKFDLALILDDSESNIVGSFTYATSLFHEATIQSFVSVYKTILNQLTVANDTNRIKDLTYSDNYLLEQLTKLNSTEVAIDTNKLVHQLFEKQVVKHPTRTAIVYNDICMTYQEVDDMSNRLANYLIEVGQVKADDKVVLFLDRNEHILIGILAVLKAGAAYVPLDTSLPEDRINYILSDTEAKIILTNGSYFERLDKISNTKIIVMDDKSSDNIDSWKSYSTISPIVETLATSLAYVIYTSGTTGRPKGVMIEHHNVLNLALMQGESFGLNSDDNKNCLWYANYVFDAHVSEVFTALCYGHTLHMVDDVYRTDIYRLEEYIRVNQIWIATIPPVLLDTECLLPLHTLVVAGDVTPLKVMEAYRTKGTVVLNAYGPTEATVCATIKEYAKGALASNIGKPIANVRVYVLDANLQRVPIGAVGELYIGGAGVARGYLNNHVLTDERFIENPFVTTEEMAKNRNLILYRSGDMARCLPNGDVEFLGRNDFQVKIRGYRIELSEIENCLMGMTGIDQVACVVRQNAVGAKFIVAYFVGDRSLADSELSRFLSERLPDYMVPSVFMGLEVLPMTVNGKLDRGALPDPMIEVETEMVAPTNVTEKTLCEIFAEVLGLEVSKVGIDCDFFRLGGDSITAIKLVNKINSKLYKNIAITSIFTYKTIRKLSVHINEGHEAIQIARNKNINSPEDQVLSFAQERLWFIESFTKGSNAYNIPIILKLADGVNTDSILQSIRKVIHRHEILRSIIKKSPEGKIYQVVLDDITTPIEIEKIKVNSIEEKDIAINNTINHIFKLDSEYPILIKLYTLENTQYLSVVVHHIAFDGWSVDILINEVTHYYKYYQTSRKGESAETAVYELPELPIQYKDYSIWQREYLTGDVLKKQIDYWKDHLNEFETLNLPTDKLRPLQTDYIGKDLSFDVGIDLSNDLRQVAKKLEVSVSTLLLSAYYLLLSVYSGQNDIILGTPVTNRNYKEISDLIGFFVNSLALRQYVDKKQLITDFIKQTGDLVNEAQLYQDLPFDKLVEELEIEKDQSKNPIFQVMFVMQSWKKNNRIDKFFEPQNQKNNIAKFDLTLVLDDSADSIKGVFNYAVSLFNDDTVASYISTYKIILQQLAALKETNNLSKNISDIQYNIDSKDSSPDTINNEEDNDMWSQYEINK